MIVFGKTTLDDSVKNMTYEELEEKFKGKIDYITLAKQLGIKKSKKKYTKKSSEDKDYEK